ncbi:MAG: BACON domain-containing protein, partial [Prevotellaceae bacterium]|nr:BACON domain-containing protein [Prevotellaceae bacterium]
MRLKKIILCAASLTAGLALVSACGGDDPAEAEYLKVSPNSVTATADGGASTITVDANVAWTIVGDDALDPLTTWFTVSEKTKTSFVIDVEPNTEATARTATVILSGGGLTATVSISQAGKGVSEVLLKVTPASADVAAAGDTSTFTVESNSDWTATSNASWAMVSPTGGSNDGAVFVKSDANHGLARTATIAVKAGDKTVNISVKQQAMVELANVLYTKAGTYTDDATTACGGSEVTDYVRDEYTSAVLGYKVTLTKPGVLKVTDLESPTYNIYWLVYDSEDDFSNFAGIGDGDGTVIP